MILLRIKVWNQKVKQACVYINFKMDMDEFLIREIFFNRDYPLLITSEMKILLTRDVQIFWLIPIPIISSYFWYGRSLETTMESL